MLTFLMIMVCFPFSSHAMMDLLVELCLQNHLNPSHHALEVRSSETQQPLSFKPNTLIGTLNVHTVFLKEKVPEEKVKPGLPKMPEVSGCLDTKRTFEDMYLCVSVWRY